MSPSASSTINKVVVHMYRMGTGDCFVVKFLKDEAVSFKMLIDCGCWSGSKAKLTPFLKALKKDVDDHVDVLVVTHEHKDHVLGFEVGAELFTDKNFRVDQIWMGWTEKDGDQKVEQWKREHGEKKKALSFAADKLNQAVGSAEFKKQIDGARDESALYAHRRRFAQVLSGFAELHATPSYIDGLAGMKVVKEQIAKSNIAYHEPGEVLENLDGLEGVRIFVLGPPKRYDDVKIEKGPEPKAYPHNDQLEDTDAFAAALNSSADTNGGLQRPFDESYVSTKSEDSKAYDQRDQAWRRIDYDWLFSAGSLALRMSSRTNNLSLVLAIEIVASGKVLLFPGDAEFGSWDSWHKIDWKTKVPQLTTEKLLNRVVFYKVAHHLSHNGTARSIGLDLMTSPELMAMATLDYDVIPDGWKSTMPNVLIIKDLLEKTKGRTLIMNTKGLLYDRRTGEQLEPKIKEFRKRMTKAESKQFKAAVNEDSKYYTELTINV